MAKWQAYFVREQIFLVEVEAETELQALGNAEALLLKHPNPMAHMVDDLGFEPDYAIEVQDV